jgi:hypothetical protein
MSRIHRVIVLNKPLKIRGFTVLQWVTLGLSIALGLWVSTAVVPKEWKIANAPAGVFIFVGIVGGIIALISALEMKPLIWWVNHVTYRLGIMPLSYLPNKESSTTMYPDPTINEIDKAANEFYAR